MKSPLKLGTRKSILARVQSEWVARELEKNNPGLKVELVGIETKGDLVLDVPLQEVEGKDFFVAELDRALLRGEVDFTVHSLKDLSLDRPAEIFAAAVPVRQPAHDVVVFHERIFKRLKKGEAIRIGSSSPRRQETIPSFLKSALPFLGKEPVLEFVSIRGNVNTRLKKLTEGFDAVVLALAGLNRLWNSEEGKTALSPLLKNTRTMLLPLTLCPSAPGQGALSVECRTDDAETIKFLSTIHSADCEKTVRQERAVLREHGGGCHQRFGASVLGIPGVSGALSIQGKSESGRVLCEMEWDKTSLPKQKFTREETWDGKLVRLESDTQHINISTTDADILSESSRAVFVSHSRALEKYNFEINARVFTAGLETWKHLAKQGIFVEGSSEGFGWNWFAQIAESPFMRLPQEWAVYTHEAAVPEWTEAHAVATYRVKERELTASEKQALEQARVLFWTSGTQFLRLREFVSANVLHCSGPGKTAQTLIKHGVKPIVFPTRNEWLSWVGIDS